MESIIDILHKGGYSCVMKNREEVRTFTQRGVADLYDLYQADSAFMKGAAIADKVIYNPQIQISAESETKRSIFREKDKTKRSKKESAQHSKSRNKSFVMTSVSAL